MQMQTASCLAVTRSSRAARPRPCTEAEFSPHPQSPRKCRGKIRLLTQGLKYNARAESCWLIVIRCSSLRGTKQSPFFGLPNFIFEALARWPGRTARWRNGTEALFGLEFFGSFYSSPPSRTHALMNLTICFNVFHPEKREQKEQGK